MVQRAISHLSHQNQGWLVNNHRRDELPLKNKPGPINGICKIFVCCKYWTSTTTREFTELRSSKDIFIKLFKVRLNIFPIVEVQSILVWISLVFAKKQVKMWFDHRTALRLRGESVGDITPGSLEQLKWSNIFWFLSVDRLCFILQWKLHPLRGLLFIVNLCFVLISFCYCERLWSVQGALYAIVVQHLKVCIFCLRMAALCFVNLGWMISLMGCGW